MVTIGFYKAPGTIMDKVVRIVSGHRYSHVEVFRKELASDYLKFTGFTCSSRNGGVTVREINMIEEHWDLIEVDWVDEQFVYDFIESKVGAHYDWLAIFGTHLINLGLRDKTKWTCSQLIAAALGFEAAYEISPGRLYELIIDRLEWGNL